MIAKKIRLEKGAKGGRQVFKIRYRPSKFVARLNELASPDRRPICSFDFGERMVGKVGNRLRPAFKISGKHFECLQMMSARPEICHRDERDILESVSISHDDAERLIGREAIRSLFVKRGD